jgi:hypothetical protein
MENTREEVYNAIDVERDYQDDITEEDSVPAKSVGDFLTLIRAYSQRADVAYTDNVGDHAPKDVIRKIAAICVECLEENGIIHRGQV